MSRRISESARVVQFFQTKPIEVAEEIFGIVKEIVRVRRDGPGISVLVRPVKHRKRKPKIESPAEFQAKEG